MALKRRRSQSNSITVIDYVSRSLTQIQNNITWQKPTSFKCEECLEIFTNEGALATHRAYLHPHHSQSKNLNHSELVNKSNNISTDDVVMTDDDTEVDQKLDQHEMEIIYYSSRIHNCHFSSPKYLQMQVVGKPKKYLTKNISAL